MELYSGSSIFRVKTQATLSGSALLATPVDHSRVQFVATGTLEREVDLFYFTQQLK